MDFLYKANNSLCISIINTLEFSKRKYVLNIKTIYSQKSKKEY